MTGNETKVKKDSQDRKGEAWKKLLILIEEAVHDEREEFYPGKVLGIEVWKNIRSLPREISRLKKIKHLMIYGSHIERLPQEIGELVSLEKFTPYTSYGIRWFPYEILECKNLKESTVSTRAVFGNYKNKKPFPDIKENPVEYSGGNRCSICRKKERGNRFEQYWISKGVGTDILPLLAITCSDECYFKLEEPAKGYHPTPHKGGNIGTGKG